jgi:hypothetical protein
LLAWRALIGPPSDRLSSDLGAQRVETSCGELSGRRLSEKDVRLS